MPAFFVTITYGVFCYNNSTLFESAFCMKTVKRRLSKNIWKEENHGQGFVCLLVGYISVKKNVENCNSVGTGAHKVEKVLSLWPNFDPNFLDICRAWKR